MAKKSPGGKALNTLGVKPQKAIHPLKKPVKLQFVPFVSALVTAIANIAKFNLTGDAANLTGAVADVEKLVTATGLQTTPEELAGRLIVNALIRSWVDLLRDQAPFPETASPPDLDKVRKGFEQAVVTQQIELDGAFIKRPANLPLLETLKEPLQEWLHANGASVADARNVVRRLPEFFTYALHEEWGKNRAVYQPLLDALDTPFSEAKLWEQAWERYAARLQRQINESMFGESFGLVHVFVPLRAYTEEEVAPEKAEREVERFRGEREKKVRRTVVDLKDELTAWVDRRSKQATIRVIAGGPGSGKSSFAKMFAAQLAAKGKRALYVPLHLIDASLPLESAIGRFVSEQGLFPTNPLAPEAKEAHLVLLLDGLDELAMQGKASAEVTQKLIAEVQRYVSNRNQTEVRLQVLLGGRDVVVDMSRADLREPGQVLHLLPYFLNERDRRQYVDPQRLLAWDDRNVWWRNWGIAKGTDVTELPVPLRREDLEEITAQPLLGYLVALSFVRGQVNFAEADKVNLNTIYSDLIGAVHERTYAGNRLPAVRHLDIDPFSQLLEEVALATWHGDGRTCTAKVIESYCTKSGLGSFLKPFEKDAEAGAVRLLTAFYFRSGDGRHEGDRTFEFTHKSFREYLTARRITRALERMVEETDLRATRPPRGWDDRAALLHWVEIAGPSPLDGYILRFVHGEALLAGSEVAARWQSLLGRLISVGLRDGLPMEQLQPRPAYAEEAKQARNAEEALLVCMGRLAEVSGVLSQVEWPDKTSFAAMLGRLGVLPSWNNHLVMGYLSHLNLHKQDLEGANLMFAHLRGANLQSTDLQEANLFSADLLGADLQGAFLRGANLQRADLQRANFRDANFRGANLWEADLQGANLQNAKLQDANLQDADLRRTDLEDAILQDAYLHGAKANGETQWPDGFDPSAAGVIVDRSDV
ncbi:MAG: pentapeptide repeat-containing protein [Polyangiaceae bacterium]|nr:pentapeptide repeat-containing protein [Polyangiaceae bacterium]